MDSDIRTWSTKELGWTLKSRVYIKRDKIKNLQKHVFGHNFAVNYFWNVVEGSLEAHL